MINERIKEEFNNGTAEVLAAPVLLMGASALESTVNGSVIVALVIGSGLVIDGIRRNIKTRLDT